MGLWSLGCRTCPVGLEQGVFPMQNKGLLPRLALTPLSGLSSWHRAAFGLRRFASGLVVAIVLLPSPVATTFSGFPSVTAEHAGAHDTTVPSTFADFLRVKGLPDQARRIAQMPSAY